VQRLTGRVLLIDPHQDRPLALVKTGWQEAVVRFPHRGPLNAFDVDDLLRLQVAPSRDWVFDVVRVELVVRMDRSQWDQRYARLGRVQRLDRFDDFDGTVRLVVVRADDFDPRHRFQRDRHVRAIEIDDVERVVISGGVVYIDRFDDDDDGDHDNDADNYD